MSFAYKSLGLSLALIGAAIVAFASNASAAAASRCPSDGTPAPGSTIRGQLEVDGFCQLAGVIVTGGIDVEPTPASAGFDVNTLTLESSRIDGGIAVGSGSSLWTGVDFFTDEITHNSSTINGGIALPESGPFDVVVNATVRGGLRVGGSGLLGIWLCGNDLYGNLSVDGLLNGVTFVGDPGEILFPPDGECAGNTIHGSVALTNSNFILPFNGESNEIEGNTISGSVDVSHSTAEVYGNTIGGSLLCSLDSVIQPPALGDPSGATNAVRGTNTCF